jgi:RNA-directed DNA polymerase
MGLELHPTKTRISHTLDALDGQTGCDFLGFSIRQYRRGRYRCGKTRNGTPRGYKTLITPSKKAVQRHLDTLRTIIRRHRAASQEELIEALNKVIRGWSTYQRTVAAKETLSRCDHLLTGMLWHWAARRHSTKGRRWIVARYWRRIGNRGWCFALPHGPRLALHAATRIKRHIKVRGTASPYDGNLLYWGRRLAHHPLTESALARSLKRQGWCCTFCGLSFRDGDLIEHDHIVPTVRGGADDDLNRQALHRHCHDTKTREDGSSAADRARGVS